MVVLWWYGEVVMSDYRVSVSVSMPEWLRQATDNAADELDVKRSELFREAVKEYVDRRGIDLEASQESSSQ